MTDQQRYNEFKNDFDHKLNKIDQFEKDEEQFAKLYRSNVEKMYNRLKYRGPKEIKNTCDHHNNNGNLNIELPVMLSMKIRQHIASQYQKTVKNIQNEKIVMGLLEDHKQKLNKKKK